MCLNIESSHRLDISICKWVTLMHNGTSTNETDNINNAKKYFELSTSSLNDSTYNFMMKKTLGKCSCEIFGCLFLFSTCCFVEPSKGRESRRCLRSKQGAQDCLSERRRARITIQYVTYLQYLFFHHTWNFSSPP